MHFCTASLTAGLMQWKDVWQLLPKALGSQGGYKESSAEVTEFPQVIQKILLYQCWETLKHKHCSFSTEYQKATTASTWEGQLPKPIQFLKEKWVHHLTFFVQVLLQAGNVNP